MKLQTTALPEYLVSDPVVDWSNRSVSAKAHEITAELPDDVAKARALFEWVRDEIPHSTDIDADVVTCSASQVLQAGTGICFAKSHLLAALLRATGIPAGFCYQVLRREPPLEGLVLHGLNGVFLASLGKWIRLDPRGNIGGIDAQFGVEVEQLAFPMDPASGEFIYDTVFAAPAPEVFQALTSFSNRTQMWPHLPQRLNDDGVNISRRSTPMQSPSR